MTEKREKVLQQDEQFLKNAYKKAVLPCILSICLFACIIWEKLRLIKLYRPFIAKRHTPTPAFPIASNNNRNNSFCCTVHIVSLCVLTPLGQIAVL